MKKSAGVLVYKKDKNDINVLLCHMGGPYWQNVDNGGWGIPKGLYNNEKAIYGAMREFNEETSFSVNEDELSYLCSHKVSKKKIVHIFIAEKDFNPALASSNTFELEWPKGSGKINSFPEMDKAQYFPLKEAKEKIIKEQLFFLNKLEEYLK